jgi:hypothetical protein
MAKEIKIVFSKKGETSIKTEGFTGAACTDVTKFLKESLGEMVSMERTSAYYQHQGEGVGVLNSVTES